MFAACLIANSLHVVFGYQAWTWYEVFLRITKGWLKVVFDEGFVFRQVGERSLTGPYQSRGARPPVARELRPDPLNQTRPDNLLTAALSSQNMPSLIWLVSKMGMTNLAFFLATAKKMQVGRLLGTVGHCIAPSVRSWWRFHRPSLLQLTSPRSL